MTETVSGIRRLSGRVVTKVAAPVPRRKGVLLACLSFLIMLAPACSRRSPAEPATISFVDPEWSHDLTARNVRSDKRLEDFTQRTGIKVKHLPTPEPALDQLAMTRELLSQGGSSPDVLAVDVIWPGILSDDTADLTSYFKSEIASLDPTVVASYTVKGKLVAVPFHSDVGVLFYRKDLLQDYGYTSPPSTWDELERMALRIQTGERAKGNKDFWGFVWPGAPGEGLTCNAIEWQASEGGGSILEADETVSVNNPGVIRAWQRAARWIGRISPPSVTSDQEWDAVSIFYSGKAAFFRGWARSYFLSVQAETNPDAAKIRTSKIGITNVPRGSVAQASTLGGFGLGISRSAAHPKEGIELIRFLIGKDAQAPGTRANADTAGAAGAHVGPNITSLDDLAHIGEKAGVVSRPSTVAGKKYDAVDQVYIRAVHSVLTGKAKAPEAAADLEKELVQITGFKTGLPRGLQNASGPK